MKLNTYKVRLSIFYFLISFLFCIDCQCDTNNIGDSSQVNKLIRYAKKIGWNNTDSEIFYASKALEISKQIKYKEGMIHAFLTISSACYISGDYKKGIEAAKKAIVLAKMMKSKSMLKAANNSIGLIYQQMGKYKESVYHFREAINLMDTSNNYEGYSSLANNLANSYMFLHDSVMTRKYRNIALKLRKKYNQLSALAESYNDVGEFFSMNNNQDSAIYYFLQCYIIKDSIGDKEMMALSSLNLGIAYLKKGNWNNAELYLLKCKALSTEINAPYYLHDAVKNLVKVYEAKNNLEIENKILKELIQLKDTLYDIENQKQLNHLFAEFETEKKELEIKNLKITREEEEKRNSLIQIFFATGASLLLLFLAFTYNRYRVIRKQKFKIEEQKGIVELKNKEILDSINYASIIQRALITGEQKIKDFILDKLSFSDYFIFFKPKEVVSGDFYWATDTEDGFYLAVCDSTGHGVPGAFMSLLNINLLNEAINVRGLQMPNEVFSFIRQQLIQNISHDEDKKDGMDGTLFYFQFKENKTNLFTSAFNAPIIIRNKELIYLSCDRMPVGKSEHNDDFSLFQTVLQQDDWLYAFSDGFSDQFGGKDKKRLKRKAFYSLLTEISSYTGCEQKQKLADFLKDWTQNEEQVDDILVVGIKA